ncbi:MAG: exosortase/archaeosortase family protein [Armatimonadota bacterium]|nr:exosortase/archaeosortase family protein [Armatimonadota bacterium]
MAEIAARSKQTRGKTVSKPVRFAAPRGSWPTVVACGVAAAALVAAYWPALSFWWTTWFEKDSFYSHGPFVPVASAFIIWANHKRLRGLTPSPSKWGYALMVAAMFCGWLAWMGASASVMGFTLPVFLFGCVVATLGFPAARLMAFPLFLLWFAAPPPESLLTGLSLRVQLLSIRAAAAGLDFLGIGAASRGTFIDTPALTLEVGSACSGYRLVVSMLAIAAFFAYVRRGPGWSKPSLVAFALPLSLAANSVRIVTIAIVGQFWGAPGVTAAHNLTGYMMLVTTAGLLLLFARMVGCARYKEIPLA